MDLEYSRFKILLFKNLNLEYSILKILLFENLDLENSRTEIWSQYFHVKKRAKMWIAENISIRPQNTRKVN